LQKLHHTHIHIYIYKHTHICMYVHVPMISPGSKGLSIFKNAVDVSPAEAAP
jgi:hypothetical protein